MKRIVLIGNGFDLAHGLKTSYGHFLDWYVSEAYENYRKKKVYKDELISFKELFHGNYLLDALKSKSCREVLNYAKETSLFEVVYHSDFFHDLVQLYDLRNWVDVEYQYFQRLKNIFGSNQRTTSSKRKDVERLNLEFDFLIKKLVAYLSLVNQEIAQCKKLPVDGNNIEKLFKEDSRAPVTFVNFNYTETLPGLHYAKEGQIIHIHGRVEDLQNNPIIFGYGDETDGAYQKIEGLGDNIYLEHIKSFGYFRTNNYRRLISLIDTEAFEVYVVGHSCGLSDRILLSEIFEHKNCTSIQVFFHRRNDASDNFKEITQEISRHFKPQNKGQMRKILACYDGNNFIPQHDQ